MSGRNWKRIFPNDIRHALRLCKDYALEKRNLSVERIADLMGVSADILYKWLASARMPALLIPSYEHICGINFVTRWQAASSGKLLIDIPTGRKAAVQDTHELNEVLNLALGAIIAFDKGKVSAEAAVADIQNGMEGLAWHKYNIEKHQTPELDFNGGEA